MSVAADRRSLVARGGEGHKSFETRMENADTAEIIAALRREATVYRHFVQAQTRSLNHVSAVKRSHNSEIAAVVCDSIIASNKVLDKPRKEQAKRIEKLAKQIPVAEWVKSIKGAGMLNLGLIIGEAGYDLSDFANPGKLWKRFGLHCMPDGKRARKFADKTLAELAGYCPRRRSLMFVVGECLMKKQNVYKSIYDERKLYEVARAPEMSKMQAHMRAHRYMEKRFLKDLWKQWRAKIEVSTACGLPATSEDNVLI